MKEKKKEEQIKELDVALYRKLRNTLVTLLEQKIRTVKPSLGVSATVDFYNIVSLLNELDAWWHR